MKFFSLTNLYIIRQLLSALSSTVVRVLWSHLYENHFDARRSTDEDTSNQEFEIAVNGPSLAHCETVVSEAMDLYWRDKSKDGLGERD